MDDKCMICDKKLSSNKFHKIYDCFLYMRERAEKAEAERDSFQWGYTEL